MIPILRQIDWLFDWEWQIGQNKNKNTPILNTMFGGEGRGEAWGSRNEGPQRKWRTGCWTPNRPLLCTHPDPTELYILEHLQQRTFQWTFQLSSRLSVNSLHSTHNPIQYFQFRVAYWALMEMLLEPIGLRTSGKVGRLMFSTNYIYIYIYIWNL